MEPKNACFPAMGKINVKPLPLAPKERLFFLCIFDKVCFWVFFNQEGTFQCWNPPHNTREKYTKLFSPFLSVKLFIKP